MLRLLKHAPCKAACCFSTVAPLVAVGKLRKPIVEGHYETGQLFLHSKLDCRGAILCPWPVRQFDRDNAGFPESFDRSIQSASFDRYLKKGEGIPTLEDSLEDPEPLIFTTDIYYQVVIDQRDLPYYSSFHRDSGVTFLGKDRVFYTVPGLDYISHNDILPYDTFPPTDKDPIYHSLFTKFLAKVPVENQEEMAAVKYNGTREWEQWLDHNYESLQLKDIHIQTTNNVRVTVYSFYLGSKEGPHGVEHWWRYSVLLQNLGDVSLQLRERNWCVFSNKGTRESVTGRGVVGQEPILKANESFQYSSHVSLRSDSGHMWGTYIMEQDGGEFVTIKIPPFLLVSNPSTQRVDKKDK